MGNRRDFLTTVGSSLAMSPLVASQAREILGAPIGEDWIDAHVHVWTPDTEGYPISPPYQKKDMVPESFTPEQLFEHSKPSGVGRVVLIQMSFYHFDNRYMLDCMEKWKGIFSGVAIVDDSKANVSDTMKELSRKGVRGFRLYADRAKVARWNESPGVPNMWRTAADEGLAICLLANPDALPLIDAMCQKFPKTRVVIDHFARIGVSGTIESSPLDDLCKLARFENVYVKTSAFYALGKKKAPYLDLGPMIERMLKSYGANRLMWASDCPYQVVDGHRYADSIALIRDKLDFLTAEDKRWMLQKTAEKVYFQN